MPYEQVVQRWHDFYLTAGAAAASLTGLLFVGLSQHIDIVVRRSDVRTLAAVTLTDFFLVLVVSLLILLPANDSRAHGVWLLGVGAAGLVIALRSLAAGIQHRQTWGLGLRILVARFGVSGACQVGIGVAGVLLLTGNTDVAFQALLAMILVLLVITMRNSWDLLVTVAQKSAERSQQK